MSRPRKHTAESKAIASKRKKRPRFKGAYLRTVTETHEIYDVSCMGKDGRRITKRLPIEVTASDEFYLHECARVVREMQNEDAAANAKSFDDYLNAYITRGNLVKNSEMSFRCSLRGFGLDPVANAKRVDYIRHSGEYKQGTQRVKLKAIKAFYNFLAKNGVDIENPVGDDKIRDGEPRTRIPTQQELDLLFVSLDATGSQSDRLYARLLRDTGARGSTIELLKPSDMDTDWTLRLYNQKQKKKMPLRTPIDDPETRELWTAVCDGRSEDALLFDHSHHDRLLRRMHALFPPKDGETLSVHSLRKAFISRLVHKGVPIDVVAQLTCTSPTILLKHYAQCSQDDINQIFRGAEKKARTPRRM